MPVDPDYYRNEPVDDEDPTDDGHTDDPTLVDPRRAWMRRKQRAMEKKADEEAHARATREEGGDRRSRQERG